MRINQDKESNPMRTWALTMVACFAVACGSSSSGDGNTGSGGGSSSHSSTSGTSSATGSSTSSGGAASPLHSCADADFQDVSKGTDDDRMVMVPSDKHVYTP